MHELLLFGQVPAQSHDLVLKVLAGLSASQPRAYTTHHLVFKPTRSPQAIATAVHAARASKPNAAAIGTQQATDVFYLQLVGHFSDKVTQTAEDDLENVAFQSLDGAQDGTQDSSKSDVKKDGVVNLSKCPWSLEYRDLPDVPGRRPVTSRQIASTPVTGGAPISFVEELGYAYTTSYVQHGHELIHNNIQLLLIQTLPVPQPSGTPPTPPTLPDIASLKSLDESGGYMLQASVRVADTRPEIINQGVNELVALRDALKGVVAMEVGERLALDTRVK